MVNDLILNKQRNVCENLKVSVIQYHQIWENKKLNLENIEKMLKGVQTNTEIVILPEMFQSGFSMRPKKIAETMQGESMKWLKHQSSKYNTAFVASLAIKENDCFYNRLVFMLPDGHFHHYDKQKLFSYSGEDKNYERGNKDLIITYKNWKIALQVCYDLRFPELSRNKVISEKYDYDLLINVANWPQKRNLHWKSLLQARAIENQSYVIGVNRVGEGSKKQLYAGESSIISPAGIIIKQVPILSCVINEVLNYNHLLAIRKKWQFLKDK